MKFLLLSFAEKWKEYKLIEYSPGSSSAFPPLGLEYLAAALEAENHKVEIIDFGAEEISQNAMEKSIKNSDVVGINVNSNNYENVNKITNKIKGLDDEKPIIIGGPHCTFLKNRSLSDIPHADIAVIGEGEHTIIDLVDYFEGRNKISNINGVYYRDGDNIKTGKPLKIIKDLDFLSFPARHLVYKYDYGNISGGYKCKKKFTTMITSRGCPFKCRFCARYSNILKDYGFRERSAENVVEEIQELDDKYGSIMIVDDNFLADNKRAHRIFDLLLDIGTDIDLLIMGARADLPDKKLYKKMKKANVKFIGYGIESGNQETLDFYNKNLTLKQIQETVRLGRKMGFFTLGTFILGAPIETKEHIEKTIEFACSLPLDVALFGRLHYQMWSDLWIEAVKNKKIYEEDYIVPADARQGLGNLTIEELKEYEKKAFKQFYWRPRYIISEVYRAILRRDFSLLKNGPKYLNSFK